MKKHHFWRVRGNSLQLRFSAGNDIHGKPVELSKTVSDINPATGRHFTDNQRDKIWESFAEDCRRGNVSKPSSLTVRDICEYHIRTQIGLSHYTIRAYKSIIETKLPHRLAVYPAESVNRGMVKEWISYLINDYETKSGDPLSPKSIRNAYGFVSAAFHSAVQDDLIRSNPFKDMRLPPLKQKQADFLTLEEASRLVAALDHVPDEEYNYKVAILLGLMCGLRRGEICGLYSSDVDLQHRTLRVSRSRCSQDGGGTLLKEPKTVTSVRSVSIPESLVSEIRRLSIINKERRLALGSVWQGTSEDCLLRMSLGEPLHPDYLFRWFQRFLKREELPRIGLHALRHTYASTLIGLDLDIKTVSTQLGHSDVNVTNRYIHQFEDHKTDIADAIDALYLENRSKNGQTKKAK